MNAETREVLRSREGAERSIASVRAQLWDPAERREHSGCTVGNQTLQSRCCLFICWFFKIDAWFHLFIHYFIKLLRNSQLVGNSILTLNFRLRSFCFQLFRCYKCIHFCQFIHLPIIALLYKFNLFCDG